VIQICNGFKKFHRWILQITHQIKHLLCTSCSFVSDWDSPILEQSVIQDFGLHYAVKHAEAVMLQRIKDSNIAVLSCSA
jgi:hypothetical protein